MHSHLHQNQNQCMEQSNRIVANGPNPRPGTEDIPMVDVSVCLCVFTFWLKCASAQALQNYSRCINAC